MANVTCPDAKNAALNHYGKLFDPEVATYIAALYDEKNRDLCKDVPHKVVTEMINNGVARTSQGIVDIGYAISRALDSGTTKTLKISFYNNGSEFHLPGFITQMQLVGMPDFLIAQLWSIANGQRFINKYGDWRVNQRLMIDVAAYEASIAPLTKAIEEYEDTYGEKGSSDIEEAAMHKVHLSELEYMSSRYGITTDEQYYEAKEILDNLSEDAFKNFNEFSEPLLTDLLNEYASMAGANMFDVPSFNTFIEETLKDKLGEDMAGKTIENQLLDPDTALYVQIYNSVNKKSPIIVKHSDTLENKRNILKALQNKKLGAFIPGGFVSKYKFAETETAYLYSVPKVNTETNIFRNITEGVSKEAGRTKNEVAFKQLEAYQKANNLYWMRLSESPNAYTVAVDKEVIDGPGKNLGLPGQQTTLAFQLDSPKRVATPKNKVLRVAERLSAMTGVTFRTVTREEAMDIMKERGQVNEKAVAFYDGNTGSVIFIEDAQWSEDTPFHEFIHPFIDVVEQNNPLLMESLWAQLRKDSRGIELINEIKQARPELVNSDGTLCALGMKEVLTQLLGEMSAKKMNEAEHKSLFDKIRTFFKSMAKFFSQFTHRAIKPEELSESTTLAQIAEMFGLAENPIKLFTIENGLQFQADEGNYHLAGETLTRIKMAIHKQIDAIKRSKEHNKDKMFQQLAKLDGMLRDIDNAALAISNMAVNAADTLGEVKKAMVDLKNLIASPDMLENPETARGALDALTFYRNVAEAYSWIGKLKKDVQGDKSIYEFKTAPKRGFDDEGKEFNDEPVATKSPMEFLVNATDDYEQIMDMYDSLYKSALSGVVFPTISNAMKTSDKQFNERIETLKTLIAEKERGGKKALALKRQLDELVKEKEDAIAEDVQGFVNLMTKQRKDVAWSEFQLGAMTRSRDTVLAAFATYIKQQADKAKQDTIKDSHTLANIWNKFRGKASASRSNVAKFNEAVLERITKRETIWHTDGTKEEVDRDYMAFVSEYDVTAYDKARVKAMETIEREERGRYDNPTATEQSLIAHNIAQRKAEWYRDNTEPLSSEERQAVKDWKRETLPTEEQYTEWLNKVENEWGFSGDLVRPRIDKFPNAKWNSMYKNVSTTPGTYKWEPQNDAGVYHQEMLAEYKRLQQSYPPHYRKGNILPSIRKSTTDKLYEKGLVTFAKGWYEDNFKRVDADDYKYGKDSADSDGKIAPEHHRIPIFFTNYMDADNVSLDLLSSLTLFAKESNHYRRMYDIKGEIDAMHKVIATQEVVQTDAKGNKLKTKAAAKFEKSMARYSIEDYARKEGGSNREAWFEAFMDMQVYGKRRVEQHVMGINIDKVVDSMMSFMAKTQLGGGNVLKHAANALQAHVQMAIEAYGNENFGRKIMGEAGFAVSAGMPAMLRDFANASPVPTSFLGQLAQEYDIIQGRYEERFGGQAHSAVSNAITGKYWMVGMEAGETYNQMQLGVALMKGTKVKMNGKEISLYDAHEMVNGKLKLKDGVEFTEQQKQAFINKLRALNEDLNGVYNQFDEPTMKRFAWGRMLLLYRNFIYQTFKRRYTKARVDLMTGETVEGYYVSTFNILRSRFKELAFLIGGDSSLSNKEKANVRKTLAELLHAMTFMVLVAILKAKDDDDEENSWMYNAMLYELVRARSETSFMIPILGTKDVMRTLATPTVASTSIERLGSLLTQIIYDPTGVYERDYGFADKGDNKVWIKAKRLIGLTGLNIHPEAAVQYYLRLY